jgi:hypothetical protein
MAVAPSWYSTQYLPNCRMCKESFEKCMTPSNMISSFRNTGISPYDPDVFNDDDFLSSAVTAQKIKIKCWQLINHCHVRQEKVISTKVQLW